MTILDTDNLDKAYEAYTNKRLMRKHLFRIVIDHLKTVEAEVKELRVVNAKLTGQVGDMAAALDDAQRKLDDILRASALGTSVNGEAPKKRGRPPKSVDAGMVA